MKETGRQAAIFEGAQSSYVWLNYLKTVHLRSLFGMLETIAFELDRDILDPSHNQSSAPVITRSRWLESATTTVQSIFQNDPWFTSLWTLQETFLRQDAILLSREATPVTANRGIKSLIKKNASVFPIDENHKIEAHKFWTIQTLAATCTLIHKTGTQYLRHTPTPALHLRYLDSLV